MADLLDDLGDELFAALRERRTVPPISARHPHLGVDDAYAISRRMLARRLATGERLVGRKIGVTSPAVQDMLGVHQPDFGNLTDAMVCGREVPVSRALIQPRAEAEIAFVLAADLRGPGVTPADALAAIATAHPCFEIVDSRIDGWRIGIVDTVADNASSGLFALGEGVPPGGLDLAGVEVRVAKNGRPLSRGLGSATVGHPLNAVAWLANTLGAYGEGLRAGDVVLSGSLVPLEPVVAGDRMQVDAGPLGSLVVEFT